MQHFALWLSFLEGNFQNTSLFDADDITIYFRICFSAIFQNVLIDAITKNSQYYSQNSSVG